MDKKEFFDKIDKIRNILSTPAKYDLGDKIEESIELLDELKDDANLLFDDEYDAGYNLGLDRGLASPEI